MCVAFKKCTPLKANQNDPRQTVRNLQHPNSKANTKKGSSYNLVTSEQINIFTYYKQAIIDYNLLNKLQYIRYV